MNSSIANVAAYLTGEHLHKVSNEKLHKLVSEHPYFSVVQFLLAKKMKDEDAPHFLQQAQKTALYFATSFLLEHNLSQPLKEFIGEPLPKPTLSQQASAIENPFITPQPGAEMDVVAKEVNSSDEEFVSEVGNEAVNSERLSEKITEQTEPDVHEKMFQNIKAMLDADVEDANADIKDATLAIDPYHTIDYFASQGIKLELEPYPQDQLGKNLKKFTQWLRHMKKLGPEDSLESMISTESETQIQRIAETSNKAKEVVTEAMAAVLEKQGKREKAIELYNKLSTLYPTKTLYFAGKIEKLKV